PVAQRQARTAAEEVQGDADRQSYRDGEECQRPLQPCEGKERQEGERQLSLPARAYAGREAGWPDGPVGRGGHITGRRRGHVARPWWHYGSSSASRWSIVPRRRITVASPSRTSTAAGRGMAL